MTAFSEFDESCMRLAMEQAQLARQANEVPVGAVVCYQQQVIAAAYNQPISLSDPTAHAEILALRQAARYLGNYRLVDCHLYVTLAPCPMCAGAITHARVKRVVFAAPDERGCVNHTAHYEQGLLQEESAILLRSFFKARR
jgi:tRNA(adenine34) deaminase